MKLGVVSLGGEEQLVPKRTSGPGTINMEEF